MPEKHEPVEITKAYDDVEDAWVLYIDNSQLRWFNTKLEIDKFVRRLQKADWHVYVEK